MVRARQAQQQEEDHQTIAQHQQRCAPLSCSYPFVAAMALPVLETMSAEHLASVLSVSAARLLFCLQRRD